MKVYVCATSNQILSDVRSSEAYFKQIVLSNGEYTPTVDSWKKISETCKGRVDYF